NATLGTALTTTGKGLGLVTDYYLDRNPGAAPTLYLRFKKAVELKKSFFVPPGNGRGYRLVIDVASASGKTASRPTTVPPKAEAPIAAPVATTKLKVAPAQPVRQAPAPPPPDSAPNAVSPVVEELPEAPTPAESPTTVAAAPGAGTLSVDLAQLKTLAEGGSAEARFLLAESYATGNGVPEDAREAARLYRLAADQGHPAAATKLGYLHSVGLGVTKDPVLAHDWFLKAALLDYPTAQYNLAQILRMGIGVPVDLPGAAEWYARAASQGHPKAQFNLGTMYLKGIGVERDPSRGMAFIGAAADSGLERAIALRESLRDEQ
ncbi:MAG: tetratricopeptide repeat protein, partial [Magnetospiraceae bacterium]